MTVIITTSNRQKIKFQQNSFNVKPKDNYQIINKK